MNLLISSGILFADNVMLSYVRPGNGRTNLPPGRFPVSAAFSHQHGDVLANVGGLGWMGATDADGPALDVILGRVLNGDDLLPCATVLRRLLGLLEAAENKGELVTLEIRAEVSHA